MAKEGELKTGIFVEFTQQGPGCLSKQAHILLSKHYTFIKPDTFSPCHIFFLYQVRKNNAKCGKSKIFTQPKDVLVYIETLHW